MKEGGCVDLSMDTLHLEYPLVLFGSGGSALTLPLFLLSPRMSMLCHRSSTMTMDFFANIWLMYPAMPLRILRVKVWCYSTCPLKLTKWTLKLSNNKLWCYSTCPLKLTKWTLKLSTSLIYASSSRVNRVYN